MYEKFNHSKSAYDVALVEVCISFTESIENETYITYCCENYFYLTLLLSKIFQCYLFWVYNFLEYHLIIISFKT